MHVGGIHDENASSWLPSSIRALLTVDRGRFPDAKSYPTQHGSITSKQETRKCWRQNNALFFRSVFRPTLACALDRVRTGDLSAITDFGDRLEAGLRRRLESEPEAMHFLLQTIVLAKQIEG